MADHEIFLKTYQELGLKVSGKTQKQNGLRSDADEPLRNGSNQLPSATVSTSASNLSMSPDDLHGIVCCYGKFRSVYSTTSSIFFNLTTTANPTTSTFT